MYRFVTSHSRVIFGPRIRQLDMPSRVYGFGNTISRHYTVKVDYESKYAAKMRQLAAE